MLVKKLIRAGAVLEIEIAERRGGRGGLRSPKTDKSPEEKQRRNFKNSMKILCRLINANFSRKDRFATLTHGKNVSTIEAKKLLDNFIRKMQKLFRIMNWGSFKYIAVTENKHGKGRIHHHIIMSAVDAQLVESAWGENGHVIQSTMFGKDFTGLAHYICKDPVDVQKKRWRQSKGNLVHPEPEYKPLTAEDRTTAPIRSPRGYTRVDQQIEYYEETGLWKYAKFLRDGEVDLATGPEGVET